MDIRHLQSYVAVIETGKFSLAADVCHITQSAVSQHIKSLEEEYGTTLIIRNTHDAVPTESGQVLYTYAKKIMKDMSDCTEYISNLKGCLTGELRIGVGNFIEPYIRQAALTMMEQYPGVKLNVEFGKACRLNQMLRDHQLDIAFTMNTAYDDEGIETLPCLPVRICAIMSKSHPLAKHKILTFDELTEHPVIMPDAGERVFATIQKHIDADLSRLKVRAVVNSSTAILSVLDEMQLITFLPRLYIAKRKDLVAVPIARLDEDMNSNVHYMKDVALKQSAKVFLGIISTLLKENK